MLYALTQKSKPGIKITQIGVLLSKASNVSRQQEFCGVMSKETQRSTDRFDWEVIAADALERARLMPSGLERNEALKLASILRCAADARGVVFAKRGRPRK